MRSSLTLLRSFKNPKSLCSQPQRRNKFISSVSPISNNRDSNTDISEKITSDSHFLQNPTINLTQTNVVNTLLSYKNDPIAALRYFNRVQQKPGFVEGLDSICVLLHILMRNSETHGHASHLVNHWVTGYPGPTSIALVNHFIECAKRFDFDFDTRVFNCLMDSYVKADKINGTLECCSRKFSRNSQNFSKGYGESSVSEYQRSLAGQKGKCRQNHGDFQLKPSRNYVYRLRGFERNCNQFHNYHQTRNLSGYNWNNNGYPQNNCNGSQAQLSWGGQSNVSGFFGGNANMQSQYGSFGETRQNLHEFNSQRLSESEGSLNGSYMQNTVQHQQISSDYYTGNVGIYHNGPSTYQQDQNAGQNHWDRSPGPYQQNPLVASTVLNNIKPGEELSEASEHNQNNGTLEEFDSFVQEGKVKEAVEVLGLLEKQCLSVDLPRLIQLMQACEEAKALEEAKAVHEHIVRSFSPLKVSTYNRILRMYSECGSMDDAFNVFNNMGQRNLTSWDTMITGLAKNGLGEDAVDLFSQFKQAGLKPDGQMFIGVFSACSVLGDIDEGMLHFKSMIKDYGIIPSMKHYVSVVDMLGSAGYLDEALEFIEKMPMEPSADVWETLMNLCRIHGNIELGDRCAELVEQLDPSRLNEKSKAGLIPVTASDLVKEKEKKKLAIQNLLEVRSRVHEYRAGDTSHPETDKIYALIRGLKAHLKESGYIPETRFVLHDIDQEGKEEALLAHSERLAVSHGLLSSPARAPIRIIKNLRVCGDCHTALKIISKIVGRQLIIRDAKRFHHFQDGLCSCQDYW